MPVGRCGVGTIQPSFLPVCTACTSDVPPERMLYDARHVPLDRINIFLYYTLFMFILSLENTFSVVCTPLFLDLPHKRRVEMID